ncbi:hypothetical protein HHL22_11970 [Hymenobacter sp. RP-2-7]|uniref:Uncharacterized protein n=1 Tax=Hymenobacter polaris TaxID=2682546 RepID=A0A7Y0FMI6_9BACT|nr:hypothetical protein [Hymenobacter polaris]NML65923.1 hypothetical protein [Hymenobacter polaris]
MPTKANTPAPVAPAAETLTAQLPVPSRAYLTATVDEASGEVVERPRFKYLPGHPRQIRFDGKAGCFNIGGGDILGKSLTFIPLALRVFADDLFNMGRKVWAELFYADEKGIVCGVLFHGYSAENLQHLNADLFYDDLHLTDVQLTATAVKKENKKVGGSYFIAEFSFQAADPAEVQARREFAEDFDLYREETLTTTAELRILTGYRVPDRYQLPAEPEPAQLPAA